MEQPAAGQTGTALVSGSGVDIRIVEPTHPRDKIEWWIQGVKLVWVSRRANWSVISDVLMPEARRQIVLVACCR